MTWWGWAILVIALIALVFVALVMLQAKRRKGGVIVGGSRGRRKSRS